MSKKVREHKIHQIANCSDCEEQWDDMKNAKRKALAHARKTGHTITGETGYGFIFYGSKK